MNKNILKVESFDDILWARINRPEALNAIDFEVMGQLEAVLDKLENESRYRVFILSGDGERYFASGGDLKKFAELKEKEQGRIMAHRMMQILERIETLDCWTIACINGDAYGGGCEISLAFDFRIASKSAKFGFTQGGFYLPPGWGGMTRLIELVGKSIALEWLAEQAVVSAAEALKWGMINKVVDDTDLPEATMEWARRLSQSDRKLTEALKETAKHAVIDDRESSLSRELDIFSEFWASKEHFRRVKSFLNKKGLNSDS